MVHPALRRAGALWVTRARDARNPRPRSPPFALPDCHDSRLLGFLRQANGTDVELIIDVIYLVCFVCSISLVALKGLSEIYKILQVTLLSWDTDGDGVVEFHEVVGAFRAYAKVFHSLMMRRKNVKSGLDGRTIEWRAALYGVLDVLAKVDALVWITTFFLMLYPSAFRRALFKPCWECDDFEAAVARQVSRLLPARLAPIRASTHPCVADVVGTPHSPPNSPRPRPRPFAPLSVSCLPPPSRDPPS
jgi:hypothetical protein